MSRTASFRSRSTIDNVMLVAVVVCLMAGIVRLAIVGAVVPWTYVRARQVHTGFVKLLEESPAAAWWARRVPYREGGDYLGVMSRHSSVRTLGAVLGVIVEQERAKGVDIRRVLVPKDQTALYGVPPGTPMVRTDGTVFRSEWAPPRRYAEFFTDVPVDTVDYQPLLNSQQAAALAAATNLKKRAEDFYVGKPAEGGSGTWVVLARQGAQREFLLVPIEARPAGGGL